MSFELVNTMNVNSKADCEAWLRSYHAHCGDVIAHMDIREVNIGAEHCLPFRIALVRLMGADRPISWELWNEPGLGLYGEC